VPGKSARGAELFAEEIVPTDSHLPYDVRNVLASVVVDGRFLEVHALMILEALVIQR
jgi:acetyl-CoA carboxylase carboxyltransferase component